MKSGQSGIVTAFAVMLAVIVVLISRMISPQSTESDPQSNAVNSGPQAQIAFISSVGRDRAVVTVSSVNLSAGYTTQSSQQNVRLSTGLPRIDIANDGTLMVHQSAVTSSSTAITHLFDYSVDKTSNGCLFAAISPDGKTTVCTTPNSVSVSSVRRTGWRQLMEAESGTYGAPQLFNTTLLIPWSDGVTSEQLIVSIDTGEVLARRSATDKPVFNRDGTFVIERDGGAWHLFLNSDEERTFTPELLRHPNEVIKPQIIAVSDSLQKLLLYVEVEDNGRKHTSLWIVEPLIQSAVMIDLVLTEPPMTAQFDETEQYITLNLGRSVYVAASDGHAFWIADGLQPVWIVR